MKTKLERIKNKGGNDRSGILSSAKKSLFAAFKNYKTGRNAPKSLHNYDGKNETSIMKDNINKFVYKGTLEQYDADLKHKKQCELIKANDCADYADCANSNSTDSTDTYHYNSNCNSNCSNSNCDNCNDGFEKDVDYLKLNYEKQDLSYAEFKQKCNH